MPDWKDLLNQLFTTLQQKKFDHAKRLRCGNCRTTLEDVLKVGRLGCTQCYDIFGSTLCLIVEQMKAKHCGKSPKHKEIRAQTMSLEDEMTTTALEGRFEDADRLCNEIKKLRDT